MSKVFGTLGTVAGWSFALFCFIAVLVYGINFGSAIILLCGIVALPLKVIRNIWEKIPTKGRRWKPILLGVLFVAGILLIPSEKLEEAGSGGDFETVTITPMPTATSTPVPTAMNTPIPTVTSTPMPTATNTPVPTATSTPVPTATSIPIPTQTQAVVMVTEVPDLTLEEIPIYSGTPYAIINDNEPFFSDMELTTQSYEFYSELDELGRCGVTSACIGIDIMPTEERGSIGQVKPTGWHTVKYDIVDGMYLYNRCHLIGYQLTGENANTRNLITGTRSMNVDGMLPFENMVADYVEETGNHVFYRVTPLFDGENLVADGVLMEAKSVEDDGEGILFNVFVYNVQDGIEIDYATGESALSVSVQEDLYVSVSDTDVTLTDAMQVVYVTGNTTEEELSFEAIIDNVMVVECEWGEWGTDEHWNTIPLYIYPVTDGTTTIRIYLSDTETYETIDVTVAMSSGVEEETDSSTSIYVWISATGSKYHNKNNCGNMNPNKAYQLELDEAIRRGYDACKKCY